MPKPRLTCSALLAWLLIAWPASAQWRSRDAPDLDVETAQAFFDEAKAASHADAGKLWGRKLYGPMLLVDPATRTVVANWRDKEGLLVRSGKLYTGTLPVSLGASNTVVDFGGVQWSMIMWPLPNDEASRRALMLHECWHRVQRDLGLPWYSPPNGHLDSPEGRRWVRLELRALRRAVETDPDDDAWRDAALDALIFRAHRRAQFDERAATEERQLELNEGLAEYSGIAVGCGDDLEARTRLTLRTLIMTEQAPSLVRNFAYPNGAAYGLLLDRLSARWTPRVDTNSDVGALFAEALGRALPRGLAEIAEERAIDYDGAAILVQETARNRDRETRLDTDRMRFVDGPILILDMHEATYTFSQNDLRPLDNRGTVYGFIRVSASWGVINAHGGALLTDTPRAKRTVVVPWSEDLPTTGSIEGQGWTLDLTEGWSIVPGSRAGQFVARKKR